MKSTSRLLMTLSVFIFVLTLFFAIPQKAQAGGEPPGLLGCCQFQGGCENTGLLQCNTTLGSLGFFIGEMCNEETDLCPGFQTAKNVPTLSQWGLIALAGVLGILAFIGIRRKKQTT